MYCSGLLSICIYFRFTFINLAVSWCRHFIMFSGWPHSRQCEIPWWFVALGMLSVIHITFILLINTCMDTNLQFTINSFRQLFPDKISLTFSWFLVKSPTFPRQLSNSLIFPGFPDKWSPCVLASHSIHYRSFWGQFYGSDDPTSSVIALKDTLSSLNSRQSTSNKNI